MQASISNTSKTITVLIFFLLGIGLAAAFESILVTLIICLVFLLFIYLLIKIPLRYVQISFYEIIKSKSFEKTICFGMILMLIATMYYLYKSNDVTLNDVIHYTPLKKVKIVGIIDTNQEKTRYNSLKVNLIIKSISVNSSKIDVSGRVLLNIANYDDSIILKQGTLVSFIGNVITPKEASNPYEFNYRRYLFNNSITAIAYTKFNKLEIIGTEKSYWYNFLNYIEIIRNNIISFHTNKLTKDQAGLLNGIILGDNAAPLDPDLKQKFINAGLAHILAASGINVALLALLWVFVTSKISLPKRYQYLGAILIVLFYTFLAGFTPSVLRSAMMVIMVLIGKMLDKNANLVVLVLLAAFLLLLYNPLMINDIGFQLSFLATFGLIVTIPIAQIHIKSIPEYIAMLIIVPLVCQIWVTPVLVYHFHYTSTFSIFSNVLAMPIVAVITYLGFIADLCVFLPIINNFLVNILDFILSPLLNILIYIAEYFSSLPWSQSTVPLNSLFSIAIYYCCLLIFLFFMWKSLNIRYYLGFISIIFLLIAGSTLFDFKKRQLEIVFFDVGDADAIYIKSPSGKNIIIDGGKRFFDYSTSEKWVIRPFLYSRDIKNLDLVLLTHPENDHIGGIPEIIRDFNVLNYGDSAYPSTNKAYNSILREIYSKKVKYYVLREPDQIDMQDGLILQIINPKENAKFKKSRSKNLNSMAIILKYKKFKVFLAADTENEQYFNLSKYKVDFEIIKVGHHGSKKALSEKYLSVSKPEIAIISAGRTKYHPSSHTIKLLEKNNIQELITKDTGAIQVISDGSKYEMSTFKKDRFK